MASCPRRSWCGARHAFFNQPADLLAPEQPLYFTLRGRIALLYLLADGLVVDLDKVPKKYAGLDGTELAISESCVSVSWYLPP